VVLVSQHPMALPLSLAVLFRQNSGDDNPVRGNVPTTGDVEREIPPADRAFVERIRRGDLAAFEGLFRTWHVVLCEFAMRYVGATDVAEDIVEDIFASLWMRRASWVPTVGIRAYLFGAVRNRALAVLRDTGRRDIAGVRLLHETEGHVEANTSEDSDALLAQIWAFVATLPETQRAVVTLRWRSEFSFEEIAAVVGSSVAAVKMQLSRAMRTLRTQLGDRVE